MLGGRQYRTVAFAVAVAVAVAVGVVAVGGVVSASHGAESANYTVEPLGPEDRQPGAADVRYGQVVVVQAGFDLETFEQTRAVFEEGNWENCSPGDGETFGIDRGNTNTGYEVDESLQNNVQRFTANEDVFEAEFYGEDDFGESTFLDDGDAVVSISECLVNPDEAGWYQMEGASSGVTADGEERSFSTESHYFWIGDFEDEEQARAELGPPPSEPESTPTPEPADDTDGDEESAEETGASDSDTEVGEGNAERDDSSTADDDGDAAAGGGAERTPTPTATRGPTPTPEPTPTPTDAEWNVVDTPTPGAGPGFGPVVAVLALLAGALLAHRGR